MICRRGDRVRACWLVLSGQIEIRADGPDRRFRGPASWLANRGCSLSRRQEPRARTADIKACAPYGCCALTLLSTESERSGEGGLDTDTGDVVNLNWSRRRKAVPN